MKKRLPFIPLQMADKTAGYAGMQYMIEEPNPKHSRRYGLFKDSITRLVMSNFKWYGLEPDEVHMIEYLLTREGKVCALKSEFNQDEQTPDGVFYGRFGNDIQGEMTYNFYGLPNKASCSGLNGLVFRANDREHFVVGFDSMEYNLTSNTITPIMSRIEELATELDEAYMAWKVASETRKCGMVFVCETGKSAQVLKKVLGEVSANKPYVVVEGEIGAQNVPEFAPNNTQAVADYHMNFMNVWGSVMDLLGLENNSQNKRERLVVSEAEMNRSLSRYISADRLQARKVFAEELNKKFGLNVRVENYLASMITETPNGANVEGDSNNAIDGGINND